MLKNKIILLDFFINSICVIARRSRSNPAFLSFDLAGLPRRLRLLAMTSLWRGLLHVAVFSLFFGCALVPFHATAYDIPSAVPTAIDAAGNICPGAITADPNEGFTARLVPCIRDTIIFATNSLFAGFVTKISPVIYVLFVMAIMFYGVKILMGKEKSTQGAIMLLLKIGAISYFTANFISYYPRLLSSLEDILNIIALPAIAPFSSGGLWRGNTTNELCPIGVFQPSEQNIMTVWNILDCYIDLIVGGIFTTTAGDSTIPGGFLAFIISILNSSFLGLIIGAMGLFVIFFTFSIIAKAVYIFITSYIAFSFMMLVSCLFVPLILFQSTKNYFDVWLKTTLSFMIQPIFVFAYLIMFMMAMDVTFFHGPSSITSAILGENAVLATADPTFRLGNLLSTSLPGIYVEKIVLKKEAQIDSDQAKNDADTAGGTKIAVTAVQDDQGDIPKDAVSLGDEFSPTLPFAFFETGGVVTTVDWDVLAMTAQPTEFAAVVSAADLENFHLEYKKDIFLAFFTAAIIIYIFYSLMEYLPYIGSGVGGGLGLGGGGLGGLSSIAGKGK